MYTRFFCALTFVQTVHTNRNHFKHNYCIVVFYWIVFLRPLSNNRFHCYAVAVLDTTKHISHDVFTIPKSNKTSCCF